MFNKVPIALVLSLALATQAWAAGSSSKSTRRTSTYDIAEKAVKAGDYRRAIPLLRKVVARNANHYDALNYLGFSHRQLGENDIALKYYMRVLAKKPNHRGANEYLGELYLKQGRLDLAKRQLARLDRICTFGCKEFDDLKAGIKVYSKRGGVTGSSRRPRAN